MNLILDNFENLTDRQIEQFSKLEDLYKYWNAQINVISRKDIENLLPEKESELSPSPSKSTGKTKHSLKCPRRFQWRRRRPEATSSGALARSYARAVARA